MKENLVSQNLRTCWGTPSSSAASEMVRNASGPLAIPALWLVPERFVDAGFHHLAGAEADHPSGVDGCGFAGFGIATHPGAFPADLENAKTRQLDLFALFKGVHHQLERAFHQTRAILSGQSHFFVHGLTEIGTG